MYYFLFLAFSLAAFIGICLFLYPAPPADDAQQCQQIVAQDFEGGVIPSLMRLDAKLRACGQ